MQPLCKTNSTEDSSSKNKKEAKKPGVHVSFFHDNFVHVAIVFKCIIGPYHCNCLQTCVDVLLPHIEHFIFLRPVMTHENMRLWTAMTLIFLFQIYLQNKLMLR